MATLSEIPRWINIGTYTIKTATQRGEQWGGAAEMKIVDINIETLGLSTYINL